MKSFGYNINEEEHEVSPFMGERIEIDVGEGLIVYSGSLAFHGRAD
ncbi:hypothetical protein [Streptococcus equi]